MQSNFQMLLVMSQWTTSNTQQTAMGGGQIV